MHVIEFKAWDESTRYALTVSPTGQVLSSTTNRLRAAEFPNEVVELERQYRYDKEQRLKREADDAAETRTVRSSRNPQSWFDFQYEFSGRN